MTLAIFDLDNTLLNGDSDHGWGEFIIEKGLVDAQAYRTKNDQFYQQYLRGELDIYAYQNFCLTQIAAFEPEQLQNLLHEFLEGPIEGMITKKSEQLIDSHRDENHHLMIITATNEIITRPIAKRLGIETLIATQAETSNGHPNGKVKGVPSYAAGKIQRLTAWLSEHPQYSLEGSYFYSDSHNDIPLLEHVSHAYAVDPDNKLLDHAHAKHWPVISLRD
jgi:HAD superfamily hydrolase (TIGR01490 family)